MRMKSIMKNKKAFSAIIASLILMLLAVAAGVVVYAYVMGWIGNVQQTSTPGTGKLSFDSITGTASTSKINCYLRNDGSENLTLSSYYINGVSVTPTNTNATSLTIQSVINLQFTQTMKAGESYTVKVVCADSTQISQSFTAQ